jgi:hypothetical protein
VQAAAAEGSSTGALLTHHLAAVQEQVARCVPGLPSVEWLVGSRHAQWVRLWPRHVRAGGSCVCMHSITSHTLHAAQAGGGASSRPRHNPGAAGADAGAAGRGAAAGGCGGRQQQRRGGGCAQQCGWHGGRAGQQAGDCVEGPGRPVCGGGRLQVCVCACACACARVCVCVRVCLCVCGGRGCAAGCKRTQLDAKRMLAANRARTRQAGGGRCRQQLACTGGRAQGPAGGGGQRCRRPAQQRDRRGTAGGSYPGPAAGAGAWKRRRVCRAEGVWCGCMCW